MHSKIPRSYVSLRAIEYAYALWASLFGLWLTAAPAPFSDPAFVWHAGIAPPWAWGLALINAGLWQAAWTWINGRWWWTPIARFIAASMLLLCLVGMLIGFARVNPLAMQVPTYGVMCGGLVVILTAHVERVTVAVRRIRAGRPPTAEA